MPRAISHAHAGEFDGTPVGHVVLAHDERHLRRKLLTLKEGGDVVVDLPGAVALGHGDALVLEDGSLVEIVAAEELLYEVTARDRNHLAKLCWHLGNRHLPAQIDEERILIGRDHVIREMLLGLGATVREIAAPFSPERGAYHSHSHHHDHDAGHHHHHV
ncbi:urease accessory protein UreE [Chelativorans salis]|uniref:Urease accessory protein UreE n=1 Tax=Chelativorans salis TaxID=2978478 RepID=A0ABT2LSV2_9HYPH|nr:urease accessory protein UreE [Chelativorans sp. EGI FJ00035]MCT7377610.1 urease accessory protein UreE [Chelativorans sp. EGI FJ00035]